MISSSAGGGLLGGCGFICGSIVIARSGNRWGIFLFLNSLFFVLSITLWVLFLNLLNSRYVYISGSFTKHGFKIGPSILYIFTIYNFKPVLLLQLIKKALDSVFLHTPDLTNFVFVILTSRDPSGTKDYIMI